jgi:hypothetical protein
MLKLLGAVTFRSWILLATIPMVLGGLVSAATLAIEWEFCMGGDARGVPAAVFRPSHDEPPSFWIVDLEPGVKIHGRQFRRDAVAINFIAWTATVFASVVGVRLIQKRRRRAA